MREKLLDLMKSEGLKPGQLADLLGINPAGISHILAGRNKPGFDLLQKILRRFPQIDPDWLLLDGPTMYRADRHVQDSAPQSGRTPADGTGSAGVRDFGSVQSAGLFDPQPAVAPSDAEDSRGAATSAARPVDTPSSVARHGASAEIARIVVFYADGTFDSYSPTRR